MLMDFDWLTIAGIALLVIAMLVMILWR